MSNRIKVIQLITGLGSGGAERLLLDMMQLFDCQKFEICVASITNDLTALEIYGCPGQKVLVFDLSLGKRMRNLRRLRDFIATFSPNVIHAHMYHSLLAAVISCCFLRSKPEICFTSHLSQYTWTRALIVGFLRKFRNTDIVFDEHQHPGMNAARTRVIPNGVPVDSELPARKLWSPGDTIKLLSVGRLAEQKDPLGLLQAIIDAGLPNWSLDVLGSGPMETQARSFVKNAGLEDRVRFYGMRSDVRDFMRKADIFVMHSRYEGMPMALLEAGAEAMPVLATPVGSIPEIIEPGMGMLARPNEFSSSLRAMVNDPGSAILAGQALYQRISGRYSILNAVRAHENLYEQLAN